MFLFYFQSNTLTVLGRQMFVNYSKSQEIKRYGGIHTHKFSHAYQPVRKFKVNHADVLKMWYYR